MIENSVYKILSTNTDLNKAAKGRYFPSINSFGDPAPYIVFTLVSRERHKNLDLEAGQTKSVFQFDIYDTCPENIYIISRLLASALNVNNYSDEWTRIQFVFQDSEFVTFEDNTKLHRLSSDFIFYHH